MLPSPDQCIPADPQALPAPVSNGDLAGAEQYYQFIREHPEISERDIRFIAREQPGARRILDIGCGAGEFVEMCRARVGDALGIDPSPASIRLCRTRRLPVLLADGSALPFASGCMEVIRAKNILEHILDLRPFVQEISRVLEPAGLLLIQMPTQYSILYPVNNFYNDYTHIRPLTRPGLRRLLTDVGLETLFIRGYTAGRNWAERLLGRGLALVFPYSWVALARKPRSQAQVRPLPINEGGQKAT